MIRELHNLADCLLRMQRGVELTGALLSSSEKPAVPYGRPLLDAVQLFEALGIGYALIGGVAAMYYGRARYTDDLDFVASTGHMELLSKHGAAMTQHGFDAGCTWKLYHVDGIQIDIWKDDFSDGIVARAIDAELSGRPVRIAEKHDLIAMKLRAARLQDDYDISEIIRGGGVDNEKIRSAVSSHAFAHFLEIKRRTRPPT